MYQIMKKRKLNDFVTYMEILAPVVAKKALPGQFIIYRADEFGERIPLTIAGYDREAGTVTIIFQKLGYSTYMLDEMEEGENIKDFAGPLGMPARFDGIKRVCVIGGGIGVAVAYPQAKALHELGAQVDFIVGFRNKDLVILEDEFVNVCSDLTVMTDDGSNGNKGFVTAALEEKLKSGEAYDTVIAVGPVAMMKAVSEMTRPYHIHTVVSMNPIMIDGTGMCGCCRLTVGGEMKFACVDGPDFDGHLVDFDEVTARMRMYSDEEAVVMRAHEIHKCRLTGDK